MTGVGVEKGPSGIGVGGSEHRSEEEFLAGRRLNGYWERQPWSLAEEADQSFDVLRSRRQEELLANKL